MNVGVAKVLLLHVVVLVSFQFFLGDFLIVPVVPVFRTKLNGLFECACALGRLSFNDERAEIIGHDEDGELIEFVEVDRAADEVIEPASEIGVAVFNEDNLGVLGLGEHFDIYFGERSVVEVRDLQLCVFLEDSDAQLCREICDPRFQERTVLRLHVYTQTT